MQDNNSSMTALVSAFARAYHAKNSNEKVFDDSIAEKLLTPEEYAQLSSNMIQGIHYFNPDFKGTEKEALDFIVNHQLAPSPVGRAAFTESKLEDAVKKGVKQYCIFAAGFDSFAYRQPEYAKALQIFEIDHPVTSADKQKRVSRFCSTPIQNLTYIQADFTQSGWDKGIKECTSYNEKAISFCSLLGISYYLSKEDFKKLIKTITEIVPKGSYLVFDYPTVHKNAVNEQVKKQEELAQASGEAMLAKYDKEEIVQLLLEYGFRVKENLEPEEITTQFFTLYNKANPKNPMKAFNDVNYCYAVLENTKS